MSSPAGLFQIVTFARDLARGNPAFVLTDPGEASEPSLADLCDTLGAGVLAVVDGVADPEPGLRFFTPDGPHPGAGHSTLAAAHVVLRRSPGRGAVTFRIGNGEGRIARTTGDRIAIGYPIIPATHSERVDVIGAALGARLSECLVSSFGYIAILSDAETVAGLRPDLAEVAALGRSAVIATAPGGPDCDIVIRVFAPNAGLPEDPVCGTAHRIIIPYWSERLGLRSLHSRHLSRRGGDLWCEAAGEEVTIAGESRLVVEGTADLAGACSSEVDPAHVNKMPPLEEES
jgi:PhzF family phenazine biosynthesis protein